MQCLVWLALLLSFASCSKQPVCKKLLRYIEENLPHTGVIKKAQGFVYVDVDDDYIHKLIGYIADVGFVEPPYFQESKSAGAHITVIYPEEMEKFGIETIAELGENISFKVTDCKIVRPSGRSSFQEAYLLIVDAPALDQIRKKYGLPKRQYEFHITVGVKPKLTSSSNLLYDTYGAALFFPMPEEMSQAAAAPWQILA